MAKANKFSIKFSFQSEFLICLSMLCVYFLEYLLSSFYTVTLTKKIELNKCTALRNSLSEPRREPTVCQNGMAEPSLTDPLVHHYCLSYLNLRKKKYIDQYNFIALFFQILSHCVLELLHNRNQLYLSTLVNKISIKV